tara:strand:- start:416 stop:754 length:339 start_codon:yes stop_codon:yes gene_type:complete
MIAPGALIANAGQEFNLSRRLIQSLPPAAYVFSLIDPGAHHVLADCINVPLLLIANQLRPLNQLVEAQWPESHDCEARELLEFKAAQNISEAEEVKKDHDIDHFLAEFKCFS